MVKDEEDVKLEKISKLLETGGTMLAQHCECGVPLFRYKGNIICPVCDSDPNKSERTQTKIKKPEQSAIEQPLSKISPPTVKEILITPPSQSIGIPSNAMTSETSEFIKNTLVNKIVQLSLDLQRETDLSRIKQQIEAIESGTKTLNNLK